MALRNLARGGDSIKSQILERDYVLEGLGKSLSKDTNPKLQGKAAAALRQLSLGVGCRRDASKITSSDGGGGNTIPKHDNPDLQSRAAEALACLATGGESIILQIRNEEGVLTSLLKLLSKNDESGNLQSIAALALAVLASLEAEFTEVFKSSHEDGVQVQKDSALRHDNGSSQQQVSQASQNSVSGEWEDIALQVVHVKGVIDGLVEWVEAHHGSEEMVTWALANLAGAGGEIKFELLKADGVLSCLVRSLSQNDKPLRQKSAARALRNFTKTEESASN
ncbi:unnamed protein product [Calypogeia fissa]